MDKQKRNGAIGIILIIILFIISSYLVQKNIDFFTNNINVGIFGILIFILIVVISIVIAPVSVIPLFPLGIGIWGWVNTAILAIIGWTIGATIAFLLARKFGVALVEKIIPIKKIHDLEKHIPDKHLFLTIIFLRAVVPIDGVSYLFGLFSKIPLRPYVLATIIGLIPSSFAISYLGTIPILYQIIFTLMASVIFIAGLIIANRSKSKNKTKT